MPATDDWSRLPPLFDCFPEASRWLLLLQRHAQLVASGAAAGRLTAVTGSDVVMRHYGESLELLRIARELKDGMVVIDVGSGAGFPGMVIAAVEPQSDVHLVEPLRKRAAFLERAADELGLANVTVHAARAEEAGHGSLRGAADIVVARAIAPLAELLEYTAPFVRPGGLFALPKGSGAEAEVESASNAAAALGVGPLEVIPTRPEISSTIGIVVARMMGAVPDRYPRRPGVPGKRPL